MLQKLWYDRPVRTQLLVAVALINLLAGVAAAAVSILNTRTATRVEIEASLEVAQRFVDAAIKDLSSQGKLDQLRQYLPQQLKHLRHVRIYYMDVMGQLSVVSPPGAEVEEQVQPPQWYSDLVRPQVPGRAVRVVAADGANPVVIVGEPADEIAEAWQDFYSLAIVWLALDVFILVLLYLVLGRVLNPLQSLSRGMARLEDGHYATRLPTPKVKELAVITNRFNTLAGALDVAREENSGLYRQLITVQEEERRDIANELHDEAGPCLFGITANASSIQTIADQITDLSDPDGDLLDLSVLEPAPEPSPAFFRTERGAFLLNGGQSPVGLSGDLAFQYFPSTGDLRGSDQFTFRVSDRFGGSVTASLEILVPNYPPEIAIPPGEQNLTQMVGLSLARPSGSDPDDVIPSWKSRRTSTGTSAGATPANPRASR